MSILDRIARLEREAARAALVTVVRVRGSTPRAAGAKMIVHADGRTEGTIGGGRVEHELIAVAKAAIAAGETRFVELELTQGLGMCCGGAMSLFVEPLETEPTLILFGAGHVGAALCRAAAAAGFAVHVADERAPLLEALEGARATYDELDAELPFGPSCFVMITTHDHALDQRLLEASLGKPARWIGVIGSARKAELTRQRLEHRGFPPEQIARVRIPVGLAIGAETPQEIAISILAELIAERRGFDVESARETKRERR